MRRTDLFEKTLMLEKIEGRRRRGQENEMAGWHHQLKDMSLSKLRELVTGSGVLQSMGSQRVGHN